MLSLFCLFFKTSLHFFSSYNKHFPIFPMFMSNSLKWEDACAVTREKKLENNIDQDHFKEIQCIASKAKSWLIRTILSLKGFLSINKVFRKKPFHSVVHLIYFNLSKFDSWNFFRIFRYKVRHISLGIYDWFLLLRNCS